MTTLEYFPVQQEYANPYLLDIDSKETEDLMRAVLENKQPYVDDSTNPDIGTRKIYIFDGHEFGSDLGRIAEANVLKDDPDWQQPPEQTAAEAEPYDDNSRFFILIDDTEEGPVLAGSLRIADCASGPSETETYYRRKNGHDTLMPNELSMPQGRDGVWDIVYVVLQQAYRISADNLTESSSAWLYYAMHKNSIETGQREWISNITDSELKNLKWLGIPFRRIVDAEPVIETSLLDPTKTQRMNFCHTYVEGVAHSVEQKARKLSGSDGIGSIIGRLASVARFGAVEIPDSDL